LRYNGKLKFLVTANIGRSFFYLDYKETGFGLHTVKTRLRRCTQSMNDVPIKWIAKMVKKTNPGHKIQLNDNC
jgi:hypothetical protein